MTCFILAYDPGIPRKRANAPIRSVPKLTIATSILPPNSQKTYRNIRDTEAMANTGTEAKLLVVDDEPNIRDLLASSLRFAGFDVVTAEDGGGAFHEAQASRPDLIVLDVMLPDMDGFTVTRRLRDAGVTTPVLFLTARDDMRDKIQGLTVGGEILKLCAICPRVDPAVSSSKTVRWRGLSCSMDVGFRLNATTRTPLMAAQSSGRVSAGSGKVCAAIRSRT